MDATDLLATGPTPIPPELPQPGQPGDPGTPLPPEDPPVPEPGHDEPLKARREIRREIRPGRNRPRPRVLA